MSKNFGYYKKQINSLETNLNNASTTLTNKINTVNTNLISLDNRTKTVETEITPIARGGTSANGAEQACVNLGAIGYRTGLSSGLSGISGFF
jgi:Neuraminidase (sialidase)